MKKMKDSFIIIVVIVFAIFLLANYFPRKSYLGELCAVPSQGGKCVYELEIPAGKKVSDGFLELNYEPILSDYFLIQNPTIGAKENKIGVSPDSYKWRNCNGLIPCPYKERKDGAGRVWWYYPFTETSQEEIMEYEVTGSVTYKIRSDSSIVVSNDAGYGFLTTKLWTGVDNSNSLRNRADILFGVDTYGENRYNSRNEKEYSCDKQFFELGQEILDSDSDDNCNNDRKSSCAKREFNNCKYDTGVRSINFISKVNTTDGKAGIDVTFMGSSNGNAYIDQLDWSIAELRYKKMELMKQYKLSAGNTEITTSKVVGTTGTTPQFPNTINTYCNRTTNNESCIVPIEFSSEEGGNIYVLSRMIFVDNDLYKGGSDNGVVCAADVKTCPNGVILTRNPNNNCQFPACPSSNKLEDVFPVKTSNNTTIYIIAAIVLLGGYFIYKNIKGKKK